MKKVDGLFSYSVLLSEFWFFIKRVRGSILYTSPIFLNTLKMLIMEETVTISLEKYESMKKEIEELKSNQNKRPIVHHTTKEAMAVQLLLASLILLFIILHIFSGFPI